MSMTVGEHKLPTIYDLPHVTEGIQPGAVIVNLNPREEFRKLYAEVQQRYYRRTTADGGRWQILYPVRRGRSAREARQSLPKKVNKSGLCVLCGAQNVRRDGESEYNFARRLYCGEKCRGAAKRQRMRENNPKKRGNAHD